MPKVSQAHLDSRRQQIVDAARARFASHGFARTSMADIVAESGLSNGAIYRYFASKNEIVIAVCEESKDVLPQALTAEDIGGLLEHIRLRARDTDHARLVAQIYAEAAVSPALASVVQQQLAALRAAIAQLVPEPQRNAAEHIAEGIVAVCTSYSQQLAIRGDIESQPFTDAIMAIVNARQVPQVEQTSLKPVLGRAGRNPI